MEGPDRIDASNDPLAEQIERAKKLIAEGRTEIHRGTSKGKLYLNLRIPNDPSNSDRSIGPFSEELLVRVKELIDEAKAEKTGAPTQDAKDATSILKPPKGEVGKGKPSRKEKPAKPEEPKKTSPGEAQSLFWWKEKDGQPLISSLVKKVAWFEDSIHDIGLTALFAIMQVRGVMPNEAINTFRRFADQKQFENYVIDGLEALLKGRLEAEKILDYERKLKASEVKEVWLETELILAKREKEGFRGAFKMAVNSMCSEDIRRLFEKKTYSDIIQGMIEAPQQIKVTEKEGV